MLLCSSAGDWLICEYRSVIVDIDNCWSWWFLTNWVAPITIQPNDNGTNALPFGVSGCGWLCVLPHMTCACLFILTVFSLLHVCARCVHSALWQLGAFWYHMLCYTMSSHKVSQSSKVVDPWLQNSQYGGLNLHLVRWWSNVIFSFSTHSAQLRLEVAGQPYRTNLLALGLTHYGLMMPYQGSTLSFLAGCPKSHFLGWYRNCLVYWYLKLDNQVVNSTCPKDKLCWLWRADDP